MSERHHCPYELCTKDFSNTKNLRRHIKAMHCSPEQYTCQICQKHLASNQSLREHKYLHTGERPYRCPYPGCNSAFRQGSQYSTHKKTHQTLNPWEAVNVMHIDFPSMPQPEDLSARIEYSIESGELPKIDPQRQGFRHLPRIFDY